MDKIVMTKQRKKIFEALKQCSLAWGFTDKGGEEYYFTNGSVPSQSAVHTLLAKGVLVKKVDDLGVGQEIVLAQEYQGIL